MWLNRLQLSVCEHSRVCIKLVQFSVPWWIHGTVKPSCSDGLTQDADCVTIVSVTQVPILTKTSFYQPVNELNLTMKVAVNRPWKQNGPQESWSAYLCKFGGSSLNRWWVMAWASSKWGKFGFSSKIWPWRSRSIASPPPPPPPHKKHKKNIGTLTKLLCTFCPNLVILAWTRGD